MGKGQGKNPAGADLSGVINLSEAKGLGGAYFLKTRVGIAEKKIIDKALREVNRFVVV